MLNKKQNSNQKGCPLKYGEETKVYRKRVPIKHHEKIKKLVLDYLDPLIVKKKKQ